MILEIRVSSLISLSEMSGLYPNIISYGDEGCIKKFDKASTIIEYANQIQKSGIAFKLITPRLAEDDFGDFINLVDELAASINNFQITLNDFGALHYIKKYGDKVQRCLGRQLVRSLSDCPWCDEIIRNESDENKKLLRQVGFISDYKTMFFKEYNIKGIEINPYKYHDISYKKQSDVIVMEHYGRTLLSIGRECPTANHYNESMENCSRSCQKEITIRPTGVYKSPMENNVKCQDKFKNRIGILTIRGKRVLSNLCEPDNGTKFDGVIIDWEDISSKKSLPKFIYEERMR